MLLCTHAACLTRYNSVQLEMASASSASAPLEISAESPLAVTAQRVHWKRWQPLVMTKPLLGVMRARASEVADISSGKVAPHLPC